MCCQTFFLCVLSWVICKLACHRACGPCVHAVIYLCFYSKVNYFQWFCNVLALKQIVIFTFLYLLDIIDHLALVKTFFYKVELEKPQENVQKKAAPKRPPTVYALKKLRKCHQTLFLWWRLVPRGDTV